MIFSRPIKNLYPGAVYNQPISKLTWFCILILSLYLLKQLYNLLIFCLPYVYSFWQNFAFVSCIFIILFAFVLLESILDSLTYKPRNVYKCSKYVYNSRLASGKKLRNNPYAGCHSVWTFKEDEHYWYICTNPKS